jgi:hypothetical protein
LHPTGLAPGEIPSHRERCVRKVQRAFIVSHILSSENRRGAKAQRLRRENLKFVHNSLDAVAHDVDLEIEQQPEF